jgi:hypothetical protein
VTKKEAKQLAQKARQYGYFSARGIEYWTQCPLCHDRITTLRNYRTFPAKKGKPANVNPATGERTTYRQETVIEALDRSVIDHVTEWCPVAQKEGL